ncbi:MAG TPA: LytTR family DNA-binding domain-containing protein [Puia sp.]|nr:LytTR family DNA-binding domain-containing protein [Puia sp.]
MKCKCIVIDDEPVARKILEEFIKEIEFLQLVGTAEHPLAAMSMLEKQETDILYLDINMPKLSGLEFLNSFKTEASVILTTAYSEHAVEAFGLDVVDYLVKPISFERFLKASNKARDACVAKMPRQLEPTKRNHFFVKNDQLVERVFYDELIYAEAMLNYVLLHTTSKKIMVYLTIKSLQEQLPAEEFIKVHKSFIVNIKKIKSIQGTILDMGTAKIGMSQTLRDEVLSKVINGNILKR